VLSGGEVTYRTFRIWTQALIDSGKRQYYLTIEGFEFAALV